MEVIKTSIDVVLIIEPKIFGDNRRFVFESLRTRYFAISESKKNRFVMMRKNYSEALRFVITGVIATITNYGFYWLFLPLMNHSLAFFLGYVIAVVVNYILTTSFTFKVKATKKNGLGFIVSNIINFTLSEVFLNLFISLGISKQLAPIPMYAVCLPINFLVVRYVMKKL